MPATAKARPSPPPIGLHSGSVGVLVFHPDRPGADCPVAVMRCSLLTAMTLAAPAVAPGSHVDDDEDSEDA